MKDESKAFDYMWDQLCRMQEYVGQEFDMKKFEFLGVLEWFKLNYYKDMTFEPNDLDDGDEWKKQKVKP